jgi:hypothetical protein
MKTLSFEHSYPVFPKQHESKAQELRHERKNESERLDGLKKVLQAKMVEGRSDKPQVA